ncbi:hypothetical protein J416_15657 [Gracilibacillus halophilus YIM-C55.5]|uniref:Uncharacterized protein n=1 Tax=Gracilibacillus halophilus YIM-C55.5 TaxID=1308866 RepID=N4WQN9_9BACI|nr:hypothetical protein [Gracilibacillus halophilus]ENH95521.1 hypothetical protein J416_15657 [Gracilibacillus halophilus YIM-C55.5]
MDKISKVLFWGGIIYFIIMVFTNMESTFHLNATQYIPEGEEPEPIRIAQIISDITQPAYNGLVLIALSYITNYFSQKKLD